NQLCFPFYAVSRLITRAYQDDLDALGITYPQYLVMMVMWEHEELSVIEIGEKLILNTNTITPLLKRMETMGLITRVPSETDHRKVMITLTAKGKAMKEPAAEIPLRLVKKLNIDVEKANIDEINQLKSKLSQLISLLKKIEQ
ncbi:MAG TPA: MarR family transcriptional regulator, partial [Paludibacteraceae bacterium]|nr:MarR family transcriptional regulator [Paludibacteraceae bacterium]